MRHHVQVYSRHDCHLCHDALSVIERARREYRLELDVEILDVDRDAAARASYGDDVPVILVDGREVARHRISERDFIASLKGKHGMPRTSLASKHCVPCHGGIPPLDEREAGKLLESIDAAWSIVDGHHLRRDFRFGDFEQALRFTNRVGAIAESEGHHPDIHLAWGRVTIEIWTHAIDGLTESDFILAAKLDQL